MSEERTVVATYGPIPQATERDVRASIPRDFRLESGDQLREAEVVGRLFGAASGPLVIVAGGISADRFATRWWPSVVRSGGAVDLDRFRVLAVDWAPGPGPTALTVTTTDQARLLVRLLDALGETRADAFVGASFGGCVGLAFAAAFPERIGQLIVISAACRAHPAATAWRGVQRRILALARDAGREAEGVALARQLAMITYRTPEEFDRRFAGAAPARAGQAYPVCDYLIARGEAYAASVEAARWTSLSDALDRHRVRPEAVTCPLTVGAFHGDRLIPLADSRELADRAPNLRRWVEAVSIYGHDAFLKEQAVVDDLLRQALTPTTPQARRSAA